jgi:hypothetical protein
VLQVDGGAAFGIATQVAGGRAVDGGQGRFGRERDG